MRESRDHPLGHAEVTDLLGRWTSGDPEARDALMPLVFEELRRIAHRWLSAEAPGHTLQPTALVSEVYLRFAGKRGVSWQNRAQFFAVASEMMRRILVDHARRRSAEKRGGGAPKVYLDEAIGRLEVQDRELIQLDEALDSLRRLDPRQAWIVELRFFVGLNNREIGKVVGISPTTVKREWRSARLRLFRDLRPAEPPPDERKAP